MVLQTVRQKLNGYFRSESDRTNRRHSCRGIGSSDDMLFSADRWSNGYKTWWSIYTAHPGHFEFARVPRHHTLIQKYIRAIQELSDQIFSP